MGGTPTPHQAAQANLAGYNPPLVNRPTPDPDSPSADPAADAEDRAPYPVVPGTAAGAPALVEVPIPVRPAAGRGRRSLWVDVGSSYALTAARVGAWAGVSALVYRGPHPADFGLLVLLRGTITLVGYSSLGLGPAMVRLLATTSPVPGVPRPAAAPATPAGTSVGRPAVAVAAASKANDPVLTHPPVLSYESASPLDSANRLAERRPAARSPTPAQVVYASGNWLALACALVAVTAAFVYSAVVDRVHLLTGWQRDTAPAVVLAFGVGTALRVLGEPKSAALQVRGWLALDNGLLAASEAAWLALVWVTGARDADHVAHLWLFANVGLLVVRRAAVGSAASDMESRRRPFDGAVARQLLGFGAGVLVAQLADFLYAPAAYVIINRLLAPQDLAAYAPAVQIDSALLLLVGGLAAALYPRVAAAHAAGDSAAVRRYYRAGTLGGAAALAAAAVVTVVAAKPLLTLWLGDGMPETRAVLPLVLLHTVIGGSAAVGRSVLLGTGRVRALTVSALVAGVGNVLLAVAFVGWLGWGLRGVVLATVVAVTARACIWMPWYVWRSLKRDAAVEGERTAGAGRTTAEQPAAS